LHDQREYRRGERGSGDAEDGPGGDQQRWAGRPRGDQRGHAEHGGAGEQEPAPFEHMFYPLGMAIVESAG
jgi:hypothetical protein